MRISSVATTCVLVSCMGNNSCPDRLASSAKRLRSLRSARRDIAEDCSPRAEVRSGDLDYAQCAHHRFGIAVIHERRFIASVTPDVQKQAGPTFRLTHGQTHCTVALNLSARPTKAQRSPATVTSVIQRGGLSVRITLGTCSSQPHLSHFVRLFGGRRFATW